MRAYGMLREWWRRLRDWTNRESLDRELQEELAFHRRQLERDAQADGDDVRTARHRAALKLGNVTRSREEARRRWSIPWLDILQRDIRYAARGLWRAPAFTLTVILTLSLGLGVNVAMYGVVDRLMFRPLSGMHDPDRVHRLYFQRIARDRLVTSSSGPYTRFLDLQRNTSSFDVMAAFSERPLAVGDGDRARELQVGTVSASYFTLFDAPPVLGRYFDASEDQPPRGAEVVVVSYAYWMSAYGGRNVLGERLRVDNVRATIIGVAPKGFSGVDDADPPVAWIPITTFAGNSGTNDAQTYYTTYAWGWVSVLARRKPDVPVSRATADASTAFQRSWELARQSESDIAPLDVSRPAVVVGAVRPAAGPDPSLESRTALWLLVVAALVLVITIANVANLVVARALRRDHETAVRLSLGASRSRLLAQSLTESLMLAIVSGTASLLVGHWATRVIHGVINTSSPGSYVDASLGFDGRVMMATLVLSLTAGLVLGLVPGAVSRDPSMSQALRSGARAGLRRGMRVRASLLIVQGTLSTVLLIGALLFVRSLDQVTSLPMGYNADRVLFIQRMTEGERPDETIVRERIARLVATAKALPDVEYAAWASSVPFRSTSSTFLYVAGIDSVDLLGSFTYQVTTPDYFPAMQTRILRGRALLEDDRAGAPEVAVVSESMARILWPGRDALGQCFRMRDPAAPCIRVVGVAEDMVQRDLTGTQRLHYYIPLAQSTRTSGNYLLLRVRGDPAALAEPIRQELQRLNPVGMHLVAFPLQEIVGGAQRSWRLGATLFLLFGVLALAVAAIGLYGVIAYSVTQRAHEIGVRVALGARPGRITRLVVGEGVRFILFGVVAGALVALAVSRYLEPLLFQQSAVDAGVYTLVALLMCLVAVCASAIPAWRASRIDPATALRAE